MIHNLGIWPLYRNEVVFLLRIALWNPYSDLYEPKFPLFGFFFFVLFFPLFIFWSYRRNGKLEELEQ